MDSKHQAEAGISEWLLTLKGKAVVVRGKPAYVRAHTWYEGVQAARAEHGAEYSVCPAGDVDRVLAGAEPAKSVVVPQVTPKVLIHDTAEGAAVGRYMVVRVELEFPTDHDMAAREVVALIRSKLADAPFKVGIVQTFASLAAFAAPTLVVAGGGNG